MENKIEKISDLDIKVKELQKKFNKIIDKTAFTDIESRLQKMKINDIKNEVIELVKDQPEHKEAEVLIGSIEVLLKNLV